MKTCVVALLLVVLIGAIVLPHLAESGEYFSRIIFTFYLHKKATFMMPCGESCFEDVNIYSHIRKTDPKALKM